jgi:hypothetical protein
VFFSGFMQTANSDAADSCSQVTVDLTGPSFARHFEAVTGACGASAPHSAGWAEKATLPAGDYSLDVEYSSEVDDTVPTESGSMSASAQVSLDLGFLPPAARFTTSLSGSTAHFNATASSVGSSDRHLVKWLWTFGDGRTATTTGPTVAHTYTAAPARAPTYAVGLQVLDSGGARSAKLTHNVLGTRTVETVSRTATKVNVTGTVAPNRHGHAVVVSLQRKAGGVFHTVVVHRPTLGAVSHFSTSFARRAAGTCRVVARYPGDATHLASQVTKSFAC